jgi:hypothetical protein
LSWAETKITAAPGIVLVTNTEGSRTSGTGVALGATLVTDIRPHPELVAPASAM